MKFILLIINFFHFLVWLFIKFLPTKLILKLVKFSNLKVVNFNLKNKIKYKNFIKKISYKGLLQSEKSTCLSRAIIARVLYNLIGLDNNLKLGFIIKSNGDKIPHAWLEDKITGEELTIKFVSKKILIFDINL